MIITNTIIDIHKVYMKISLTPSKEDKFKRLSIKKFSTYSQFKKVHNETWITLLEYKNEEIRE